MDENFILREWIGLLSESNKTSPLKYEAAGQNDLSSRIKTYVAAAMHLVRLVSRMKLDESKKSMTSRHAASAAVFEGAAVTKRRYRGPDTRVIRVKGHERHRSRRSRHGTGTLSPNSENE